MKPRQQTCVFFFAVLLHVLCVQPSSSYNYLGGFLHAVGRMVGIVEETIEGCEYTCDNGVLPRPKIPKPPQTQPYDCGSYGLNLDTSHWPGVKSCCVEHDKCYGTCLSHKATCDQQFRQCLKSACKVLKKSLTHELDPERMDETIDDIKNVHSMDVIYSVGKVDEEVVDSCMTLEKMFVGAVETFGCSAFQGAQRRVCSCSGHDDGNSNETVAGSTMV